MDSSSNNNDFSSSLVQEIAASLTDQRVPDRYIHKDDYPPAKDEISKNDLLVDFSRLWDEDGIEKLRSILSTWGCFQVVNHGIETNLLEKVLEVSRQFFALPLEEKKKSYRPHNIFLGYGNDGVLWGKQTQNWNDRLYLKAYSEDPAELEIWPDNPPEFRKIVGELTSKIKAMPKIILKAMARSLDLEQDCFLKQHGPDSICTIKLSYYPKCPKPDRVLGIAPHSDVGTTLTLLLQDQEGLQVMLKDQWYKVPTIPGALFVNVGDLLEIMSNGVVKSTIHRVVTYSEKERVSVAMFYNPGIDKEVGPIDEVVTTDRPPLYKKTNVNTHVQVFQDLTPKGKSPLSAFKV